MQSLSSRPHTCRRILRLALLTLLALLVVEIGTPAALAQPFSTVHNFIGPMNGVNPQAALIKGMDGALYGTTKNGSVNNLGTLFRVNPDGTGFRTLDTFSGKGSNPVAAVFQGKDGALYGTTYAGGWTNSGTLFKVNPDGKGFQTLYSFIGNGDGANPAAAMIQGPDGALYGTTQSGGWGNGGILFKVNPDGSGLSGLINFGGLRAGSNPSAAMVLGKDGALYGMTPFGGAGGAGTLFKVNLDGTTFQTLHQFSGSDGSTPLGAPIQGTDGAFYGTTSTGGASGAGTLFKVNPDGSGFQTLHAFTGTGSDGSRPVAAVIQGTDGLLYGTTSTGGANGFGTLFKVNIDGTGFQTLHSFTGTDGSDPSAALLQDTDGTLYGTTYSGGLNNQGTLFKVNPDGSGFQTFHSFIGSNEGNSPLASLIQGKDGALYGTTPFGGVNNDGTLFKMNPDGTGFRTLHAFTDSEGSSPIAAVLQGRDSALYGTTSTGGANGGFGTLFKMNTDGSGFQTLHQFSGSADDGSGPIAALIQDKDGTLYGTTPSGGANGIGTLFKLNTDGSGFQTLHSFTGTGSEGSRPSAVIQGRDGALYGTTQGNANNLGTLFKMNPDGTGFQTLYSFNGSDGYYPSATVILGIAGTLYGTTNTGGASNLGTLFKVNTDGSGFQILHSFTGSDGNRPLAAVLQSKDGILYGTTQYGGTKGSGTLYKVNTDGTDFQTLHSFIGGVSDGSVPLAALSQGTDGILYGTTQYGGKYGFGTIFRLALPPRFDVNGDGHLDLLWYNQTTGDLTAWLQNGTTNVGSASLASHVDLNWKITGVADLNGDGNADLLWRNQVNGDLVVWYMQGANNTGYAYLAHSLPLAWQVVSSADFNADGNPDLLLKNIQTGDIVVWYMQGTTNIGYAYLAKAVPLNWQLTGSTNFYGSGHVSLLWRDQKAGDLAAWDMLNTQLISSYTLAAGISSDWQIGAVGDLDGNRVPDIVWRNTRTEEVAAWLFTDATHYSGASIASGVPNAWQLVGPR